MEKNTLKVTVSGCANTGKSTLTWIIMNALIENGIEVEFTPDLDYKSVEKFVQEMLKNDQQRREAVSSKAKVVIDQVQLARNHFEK